jgi:hypothetical protein
MANIKTKEDLIKQLECTKHTFHISTYGIANIWHSFLQDEKIMNYSIVPENLMHLCDFGCEAYLKFYDRFEDKKEAFTRNCQAAFNSAERIYIRETYEWLIDYLSHSKQNDKFWDQEWARMITLLRNVVSHNWIIKKFNNHEIEHINQYGSISYYDVKITENDEGKHPADLGWNRYHTMNLCDEILKFAHALK